MTITQHKKIMFSWTTKEVPHIIGLDTVAYMGVLVDKPPTVMISKPEYNCTL